MSEQKQTKDKLDEYGKQQGVLLKISFLFNSGDDFVKQVADVLNLIGLYTKVSRVYIYEDSEDKSSSKLAFDWLNEQHNIPAHISKTTHISYEGMPFWKTFLSEYGHINSNSTQAIPEDIRKFIQLSQAKSTLIFPLLLKGQMMGFIGFDDYEKNKYWEDAILEFVAIVSNIISQAFERHYTIQELKEIVEKQDSVNQELIRQNNDLQQFTYIVSHNLRAPIANLLGLVSLFRPHEPLHEVNRVAMENIKTVSQQLDLIARDLNEIVEIKEHIVGEVKENILIKEEIEEVLRYLDRQIYTTQAQIVVNFTKVSYIFTIKKYLNSILLHLLSNALKYKHPDRSPIIRLSDEIIDDFICLTIEDNGLGIDLKKNATKIFGLHKRFHYHVGGRGIGLYLVKLQAEALGGGVEVESQPEKGSVFKVYLPK